MQIICYSDINWDFLWQRQQQLLTRFPEETRIFFIDSSFWRNLFSNPLKVFPHKVKQNIIVLSLPLLPLVFNRYPFMRKFENRLILFWTKVMFTVFQIHHPVLLFYEPRFSCVLGSIGERLSCYEIIDNRMGFKGVPQWITGNINDLLEKSTLITVSAHSLYDDVSVQRTRDVYYIGNGVDFSLFQQVQMNRSMPKDIAEIQRPIIGYVGVIAEWMDFRILKGILEKYPHYSLVLIGPVSSPQARILQKLQNDYPNLFVLGKKEFDVLPQYIYSFDVGIIPFLLNDLTRYVNPNKLFEYLAAGKPVISTDLPEIQKYREDIYIVNDIEEFITTIEIVLKTDPEAEKLIKIASENSWDRKASNFYDILKKTQIE